MPILEWEALTRPVPERTARWYAVGGGCVVIGAAWGILSGNWSFALAAVLLGGAYFLTRNARNILHRIRIEEKGVVLDDTFTGWDDCGTFWLLTLPGSTELHIQRTNRGKEIVIRTGDVDPALIRATLGQFLTEQSDRKERFVDTLVRIFKL